jgi:cell division protein FtsQ
VLVAVAVAALVAALVWLVGFSSVLSADSVRVDGVANADAAAVLDAAGVPLGAPLARVDTGAIAGRVERDVAFVKEAAVHRAWPHTVVVEVEPRTAVVAVRGPQEQVTLVDDEGVSFRDVESVPAGLPVVDRSTEAALSTDALHAVIEVLGLLSDDQRATVTNLLVSGYDQVSFTLGKVQVVWGGRSEGPKKLAVLNALLRTNPALVDVSAPDTPITR